MGLPLMPVGWATTTPDLTAAMAAALIVVALISAAIRRSGRGDRLHPTSSVKHCHSNKHCHSKKQRS
jgi:hypothetical protein